MRRILLVCLCALTLAWSVGCGESSAPSGRKVSKPASSVTSDHATPPIATPPIAAPQMTAPPATTAVPKDVFLGDAPRGVSNARSVETPAANGSPAAATPAPYESRLEVVEAPAATEAGAPSAPPAEADATPSREMPPVVPERSKHAEVPVKPQRQSRQSGLLTAGSFDDRNQFAAYANYLQRQHVDGGFLTNLGQRVEIEVHDSVGRPVGDVRLEVQRVDAQQQILDVPGITLTTASDGRALFLTGFDGRFQDQQFAVTAVTANGNRTAPQIRGIDGNPWKFVLPDSPAQLPNGLDLAFVVDTTGSMSDELEYLKVEFDGIAAAVKEMFPNVDQRFALIVYRDHGDRYVTRCFDFTSSVDAFRETLSQQRAEGGGDYPEAMHLALQQAQNLSWRDRNTARVLFLVGDAPPHEQDRGPAFDAIRELRRKTVRLFPVGASGVAAEAEFVMRAASFLTGGQYLFLTDHSGVGNPHAVPDVPAYSVERLDLLMLRMIASELAGRRLTAQEIIAHERPGETPQRIEPQQLQSRAMYVPSTTSAAYVPPAVPMAYVPPVTPVTAGYSLDNAASFALSVALAAVFLICILAIDRRTC